MKTFDHPQFLVEALCVHELFKRFGYDTREMFFVLSPSSRDKAGLLDVLVELRHRGKRVPIRVGDTNIPADEVARRWTDAVIDWNNHEVCTPVMAQRFFDNSFARKDAVTIIAGMLAMGLGSTPEQIVVYDARARAEGVL